MLLLKLLSLPNKPEDLELLELQALLEPLVLSGLLELLDHQVSVDLLAAFLFRELMLIVNSFVGFCQFFVCEKLNIFSYYIPNTDLSTIVVFLLNKIIITD
jgi:hypothetical protein